MANPQTENGHVEIANDLWEALMGAGLNKNEYRAVLCILRYSYGVKLKYAKLRKKEIAMLTRIPFPKVNETLTTLGKKNIIRISQKNGYIYFHKDYDKWQLNEKLTFSEKWKAQVNETLTKNLTKREVKLNETLTSTSKKDSGNKGSRGSKESKESIKESKPKPCEAENLASPSSLPGHPARQGKETKEAEMSQIRQVFKYWQQTFNHPKALLSKDRAGKIRARLRNGYDPSQLKRAIDGCKASSYHMGDNDAGKVYDSISLIFRNAEKLEDFWGYLKKKEQSYDKLIKKYSND